MIYSLKNNRLKQYIFSKYILIFKPNKKNWKLYNIDI